MEARPDAPATPAKTFGKPVTLQFSNAPKKQINPYVKIPIPEKSIERYDIEQNRVSTLIMDKHGRYIENGVTRTLDKTKENKNYSLEDVHMADLDGISQPGYSYEKNKEKRESEETENDKDMEMKKKPMPSNEITTQQDLHSPTTMNKTQGILPPTQKSEAPETTPEDGLLDDDAASDDRYTRFLSELNKVIAERVDLNVKPQMDKCLDTITQLIQSKIGGATQSPNAIPTFGNQITPSLRTPNHSLQKETHHTGVSFSSLNSLQYIESPYRPAGTLQVPSQTPAIIGLVRLQDQEPIKLSGKDDKVHHIREDLESQHHQLQPLVINLARVSLLATKEIHLKLKKLGMMDKRDSNGDPLHIPKSTQCNTTYNIPDNLEKEENLQNQKSKIDRIAKEATVRLAIAMADAVRMEIQHLWNHRVNKIIDEIIKIAKHITRQISKNESTEDTWQGAPEGLKPFYCIVHFASEMDKDTTSNFLRNHIIENEKQFIDKVGLKFNIADVSHHLQVIACRALSSNSARRHLNIAAAWLMATILPATVKLQQHVEHDIRAKEIESEITVETQARSINTASKAVADALIKTTESCPTDIQGTRIAALVAKEVKAELKREASKKDKGRQRDGPTQPAHFQTKAQKKRMKHETRQQERHTDWPCPAGFPPTPTNEQHSSLQPHPHWTPQQTNATWTQGTKYTQPQPPTPLPTHSQYHLPQNTPREYHQTPYEERNHQSGRDHGQIERSRGRSHRGRSHGHGRGRGRGRGRQNPHGRGSRGRENSYHQHY